MPQLIADPKMNNLRFETEISGPIRVHLPTRSAREIAGLQSIL